MSAAATTLALASSSGASLFGRKYKLELTTAGGDSVLTVTDSDFEPEALRIMFDVYMPAIHAEYWFADIDIYNFDQFTTEEIVTAANDPKQGMLVTLRAGYSGNFDVIFTGPVFQPLWSRENVTDYKVTLRCILSLSLASGGAIVSAKYSAGANQTEMLLDIIKSIGLHDDFHSPSITTRKLPRGVSLFGGAEDVFTDIAEDNNMLWFLSERGLSIGSPKTDIVVSDDLTTVYTPNTGLIGTPEQTQWGVNFTVLLDPRLKAKMPLMSAKIDQSVIRQYKKQLGEPSGPLDRDGIYIVGAVRHIGDSRGVPWYTEVTGYVSKDWALAANVNR